MNTRAANSEKHLLVLEEHGTGVPKGSEAARIGHQITFNAEALNSFDVKGVHPVHYDLLVLCAAIEFADCRWKRPKGWSREIRLTLPVTDLHRWSRPEVQDSLHSVLLQVTSDDWQISFVQANDSPPIGQGQKELTFPREFVIAYSEGLDSRAVSALSGGAHDALCIRVSKHRQRRMDGDSYFTEIPFRVHGHGSLESSFRSRGFQFAVITAIAAQLSGIQRIVVPESGQGALGPALLPLNGMQGDYRNHPTFFRKMERFIKAVLEHQVNYEQPRLWFTKGQTLSTFLDLPGKAEKDLLDTRSCWQRKRVVNIDGDRKHCGLCAACLLRRMSMHAARIDEDIDRYVVSDLGNADLHGALSVIPRDEDRAIMMRYGSSGTRHLQHLAVLAEQPDERLRADTWEIAHATGKSFDETLENLRTLLRTHAHEWRAFVSAQGKQSFLRSWMDGGRDG